MSDKKPPRTWITKIGYPEPDKGPLQVLRSPEPVPAPEPEPEAEAEI